MKRENVTPKTHAHIMNETDLPTLPKTERTMPTTEQLATLAARLARQPHEKARDLAAAALELWRAAEDELSDERLRQQGYVKYTLPAPAEPTEIELPPPPPPKRYPITRDEFFRLMLPHLKGRTAELAETAKAYCRASIQTSKGREATQDEVVAYYAGWKDTEKEWQYQVSAQQFHNWWNYYHSKDVSEKRRNAGRSMQEKAAAKREKEKNTKASQAAASKATRKARPQGPPAQKRVG